MVLKAFINYRKVSWHCQHRTNAIATYRFQSIQNFCTKTGTQCKISLWNSKAMPRKLQKNI